MTHNADISTVKNSLGLIIFYNMRAWIIAIINTDMQPILVKTVHFM